MNFNIKLSYKKQREMAKVCEENKDKFSSMLVGKMGDGENEYELHLFCIKVDKKPLIVKRDKWNK